MKTYLFILFLAFSLFLNAQIPASGLKGYWPFDGNGNDYSGFSNNGVVNGATPVSDRFGNVNHAYAFDGVSNTIMVNHSSTIDMTDAGNYTFAFWIKTYPGSSNGIPVSKNTYGSFSGYEFFTNNQGSGYCNTSGQLSFYTASGANQDACADSAICNDYSKWYFITGTYNGTLNQSKLYVNSRVQADIGQKSGSMSNTVNLCFGSHPTGVQYFLGALDGVRFYDRILTDNEITVLYNEPNPLAAGVEELTRSIFKLECYPNPTNDVLKIGVTGKETGSVIIEIIDNLGKIHYSESKEVVRGSNEYGLNLGHLSNGIYILKIKSRDEQLTEKISVLK